MKKRWIFITVIVVSVLFFGLTYIPHKVVNIDSTNVSKITVFDGGTGYQTEITNNSNINHIINNLNGVTFQKGMPSFLMMGYSFKTRMYDKKGEMIKELIINSNDNIRCNGFFYFSDPNAIDYEYIKKIVRK